MFFISSFSIFIAFIPITVTNSLIEVTATQSDTTASVATTYTINFTTIANFTVNPVPPDRITSYYRGQ